MFVALFAASCANDSLPEPEINIDQNETDQTITVNSGILAFNTSEELFRTVSALKEADKFDVKVHPATRSGSSGFTSLRQSLIEQGLRNFTDAELAEISAEELIYEPEDEIIIDPYLAAILNQDREVQVGNSIIRYVDEGMFMYDAGDIGEFDDMGLGNLNTDNLTHGDRLTINDRVQFVKIEYLPHILVSENDMGMVVTENPSGGYSVAAANNSTIYNNDGSLKLSTGVKIPKEKIKRTTYKKGNGDANWVQRTSSGIWGTNVTLENNYDKRHRMKLRMYDQDYILYRAVGMTVRMQQRTLGVWWRKKAQEFRYGWTAIECEYKYSAPSFLEPPKMPNGLPQYEKYPFAMAKKFPFEKKDIVLFHIPYAKYDVTTGDVNKVFDKGVKALVNQMNSWYKSEQGKNYTSNPKGLYTTHDNDRKILVVYPQGEEVEYNDGREVVRWEMSWFSGNFVVGFSNNMAGGGWTAGVKSFGSSTDVKIIRGRVYGAVKYNNEWRACIIETE